jgi:hypothetical protein
MSESGVSRHGEQGSPEDVSGAATGSRREDLGAGTLRIRAIMVGFTVTTLGTVAAHPGKLQEISLRAGPDTKRVMAKNNRPIEQGCGAKLSICSGTNRLTTLDVDAIP